MLAALNLVAALAWDPQIRGIIIVVTAFLILIGSVYMLLATNTGLKLGFLIAAAGFTGWVAVMAWIWVAYGIGIKGDTPHWEVQEVVTGELSAGSAVEVTQSFPNGWEKMETGNPLLGDATATADHTLVKQTGGGGHGEGAAAEPSRFAPIFEKTENYTVVGGYRTGGKDYFIPGGYLERNKGFFQGWLHSPHYAVIQVRPVIPPAEIGGAPPTPVADPAAPVTNVVMVRNLGDLRLTNTLYAIAFSILFGVLCYVLHRRDKQIMALRAAPAGA